MKKNRNRALIATLCAAVAFASAGAISNGAYADGLSRIYVYDSTTSTSCNLYHETDTTADCAASYGSYDTTTGVLTLGADVNGKSINIVDVSNPGNSYTIKSTGDVSANLSTPSYATITFDLGEHSWTQNDEDSYINMPAYGTTIIKSGTLNLVSKLSNNVLQIDGGAINTNAILAEDEAKIATTGNIDAKIFEMNGGVLNMKNVDLRVEDTIDINDGEITIENKYGMGGGVIRLSGSGDVEFNLNDGSVTLDAKGYSRDGINAISTGDGSVTININGGALNINNTEKGISADAMTSKDAKVNFNGGVSTFKNSADYAVKIDHLDDPEHAIAFGEGIGIIEPKLYVFWIDENWAEGEEYGQTGIVAENTLTIAEGGKVTRHYGWEIGYDDNDTEEEESDLKVPDTGMFSGENGNGMIMVISLGLLALVSVVVYAVQYAVRRYYNNMKFRK